MSGKKCTSSRHVASNSWNYPCTFAAISVWKRLRIKTCEIKQRFILWLGSIQCPTNFRYQQSEKQLRTTVFWNAKGVLLVDVILHDTVKHWAEWSCLSNESKTLSKRVLSCCTTMPPDSWSPWQRCGSSDIAGSFYNIKCIVLNCLFGSLVDNYSRNNLHR